MPADSSSGWRAVTAVVVATAALLGLCFRHNRLELALQQPCEMTRMFPAYEPADDLQMTHTAALEQALPGWATDLAAARRDVGRAAAHVAPSWRLWRYTGDGYSFGGALAALTLCTCGVGSCATRSLCHSGPNSRRQRR